MTLLKTALKNLKRSPVMNAISLLQLVNVIDFGSGLGDAPPVLFYDNELLNRF